jgi:pSer/pThr/pTyr-binding forkhead associated (FHA) protein
VAGSADAGVERLRLTGQLRPIQGPAGLGLIPLPRRRAFVVGRDAGVDLQVVDERVSRKHARIELRDGVFVLTDLNSTNGVFVNGVRVAGSTALAHEDEIEIANFGEVRLRFELRAQPATR